MHIYCQNTTRKTVKTVTLNIWCQDSKKKNCWDYLLEEAIHTTTVGRFVCRVRQRRNSLWAQVLHYHNFLVCTPYPVVHVWIPTDLPQETARRFLVQFRIQAFIYKLSITILKHIKLKIYQNRQLKI